MLTDVGGAVAGALAMLFAPRIGDVLKVARGSGVVRGLGCQWLNPNPEPRTPGLKPNPEPRTPNPEPRTLKAKPGSRNNVRVNVVFGLDGIDRSRVDPNDIFSSFLGDVVLDRGFDAADAGMQELMDDACRLVGNRTDLVVPLDQDDAGSADGAADGEREAHDTRYPLTRTPNPEPRTAEP